MKINVIFLDRDGVINKNRDDYVKEINEFEFISGSIEALKKFRKLNYELIIVTNQSIINRGIINKSKLEQIHSYMINVLKNDGVEILDVFICPHRPEEKCICRKPKSGLIDKALDKYNININKSYLIGDRESDIQAGKSKSLSTFQITCKKENVQADFHAKSLYEVACNFFDITT